MSDFEKIIINEISLNPIKWFKSKTSTDDELEVGGIESLSSELIIPFITNLKIKADDSLIFDIIKVASWFATNADEFSDDLAYIMKGKSYFFDQVLSKLTSPVNSEQALNLFKGSSKYSVLYRMLSLLDEFFDEKIYVSTELVPIEKDAKLGVSKLLTYSSSIGDSDKIKKILKSTFSKLNMTGKLKATSLNKEKLDFKLYPVIIFAISIGLSGGDINKVKTLYTKLSEYMMTYLLRTIRFIARTSVYFKEYPVSSDNDLKQGKRAEDFFGSDVETDVSFDSERSEKVGGSLSYNQSDSEDDTHKYMNRDLTTDLRPNSVVTKYEFNFKKGNFEGQNLKGLTQTNFIDFHKIITITNRATIMKMLKDHIYNFARADITPDPIRKWTLTYVLGSNSKGEIKSVIRDVLNNLTILIGKAYKINSYGSAAEFVGTINFKAALCDNVLVIQFDKLEKKGGIINKLFNKTNEKEIYTSIMMNINRVINNSMVGKKVLQESEKLDEIKGVIYDINTLNESETEDSIDGISYVHLHSEDHMEIRNYAAESIIESILMGSIIKDTYKPIFGRGIDAILYLSIGVENGVEVLRVSNKIPDESYIRLDMNELKDLDLWGSNGEVERNKKYIVKYLQRVVDGTYEFHFTRLEHTRHSMINI